MDPRIKIIYIRQLNSREIIRNQASIIPGRLKEWSGHPMYTNEEILKWLKMGIRWHSGL